MKWKFTYEYDHMKEYYKSRLWVGLSALDGEHIGRTNGTESCKIQFETIVFTQSPRPTPRPTRSTRFPAQVETLRPHFHCKRPPTSSAPQRPISMGLPINFRSFMFCRYQDKSTFKIVQSYMAFYFGFDRDVKNNAEQKAKSWR